jgi:hypothetical protein
VTNEKYWLNQKNLIYVALRYERNPKKFIKIFITKNPIRFARMLSYLIYWLLILLFVRKRSSLQDSIEENVSFIRMVLEDGRWKMYKST